MSGYGADYYTHYSAGEYARNPRWLTHFDHVAAHIIRQRNPATVFDAGCALGILVERLRARGVAAWGCDTSSAALELAAPEVRPYLALHSITAELPRRYAVITCIEVVEHMPTGEAVAAIANLCRYTDTVLFSSTPYDVEDATHINVRPHEYWAGLFLCNGFHMDAMPADWLTPWARWYVRTQH